MAELTDIEWVEVNKPSHYNSHPSGLECIQFTTHMNFNLGNAFKYLWRAGLKGSIKVDLSKALYYLKAERNRLDDYHSVQVLSRDKVFDHLDDVLVHFESMQAEVMRCMVVAQFIPNTYNVNTVISYLEAYIDNIE